MQARRGVHLIAQGFHPVLQAHHVLHQFFRLLEHQHHGARQFLFMLAQDLRGAQKPGDVAVVAAGMADALILRDTGLRAFQVLRGFQHGQGVDVRPQQDGLSRLSALDEAQHAGVHHPLMLNAHGVQLRLDAGHGLRLLPGDFRMAVELPPHADDIVFVLFQQLPNIHFDPPYVECFMVFHPRHGLRAGSVFFYSSLAGPTLIRNCSRYSASAG